jgi:transcriptional regulator with XRE-family HTH domain
MEKARKNSGLTMKDTASKLDITESYYSMIESGQRQKRLDITLAAKLSVVFGIPIETIINEEKAEGEIISAGTTTVSR